MGEKLKATRDTVRRNLRRLMDHARDRGRPDLATAVGIEIATDVSDTAILRFLRAERPIDVDQLTALAAAYELQPWELLYPDLDPDAPPSAQIETLYELAHARLQDESQKLASLGGGHVVGTRTKRRQDDGDDDHQVPAAGEEAPKRKPKRP